MCLKRKTEDMVEQSVSLVTNVRDEPPKAAQNVIKMEDEGIEQLPIVSTSRTPEEANDPSTSEKGQATISISKKKPIESSLRWVSSYLVCLHLKNHSLILAKHNLELESASTSEEDSDEEEESSESSSDSSDSDSSSSSSDSLPSREPIDMEDEDLDEESKITKQHKKNKAKLSRLVAEENDPDDDSDSMGEKKRNVPVTAHEIAMPTVVLPSITEIGPDEPMELIGEVLNVVDSVVVVKSAQNGMQRVLDTESLLVFEDRKVLGLVSGFVCGSFSMQVLTINLGVRDFWPLNRTILLNPLPHLFTSTGRPNRLHPFSSNQSLPQPQSEHICVHQ
jgi:hypothetical protein